MTKIICTRKNRGICKESQSGAWLGMGTTAAKVIIWEFSDFAQLQCQLARRKLSPADWEQFLPVLITAALARNSRRVKDRKRMRRCALDSKEERWFV